MRRTNRGLVAIGAAIVTSLGLMSPVAATAGTAAPGATSGGHDVAELDHLRNHDLVENRAWDAFQRAVEPTECTTTPVDAFVSRLAADLTEEQFEFVLAHPTVMLSVPLYDSLFFGAEDDPDYALETQAPKLRQTFRDLTRFWSDIRSDDIQVLAMRGDVLLDAERIAATLTVMVELGLVAPMTAEEIATESRTVADYVASQGTFYDNPLWSLNAYAFTGEGSPSPLIAALPDRIVVGDGLLAAYDALGLSDVGPRAIMSHEFAHHVQLELGTFDTGPTDPSEATRRTELMADALAAYHGAHKKGLTLNEKRVADALETFAVIGDCLFDDPGHHGTPLQRERAAEWGADLADAARPRSLVLPAETVIEEFDAALPGIVAGG